MLKPFGGGGTTHDLGYDLPLLLGHLEALKEDEEGNLPASGKGMKWKRIELVDNAIAILNEAADMGNEDR
jgi:hypothetical protein